MDTSFALGVCFVLPEREINKRGFFFFFFFFLQVKNGSSSIEGVALVEWRSIRCHLSEECFRGMN